MPTLLIEHAISDFDTWYGAFGQFAARRKEGGVLRRRIMRLVGDPRFVLIDLEFATLEEAEHFSISLRLQIWSTSASSPALVGNPRARIAEVAPAG